MISVIIPKYDDSANIVSCLNSIKRQTFDDVEILVINDNSDDELIKEYNLIQVKTDNAECYGLNEAIAQAKGEYIYFCNASSVLSPNTLSELMKVEDDYILCADVYVSKKDSFVKKEQILSCYGKLFKKSIVDRLGMRFVDDSIMSEKVFVATYLSQFEDICHNSDIFIYDLNYVNVCKSEYVNQDAEVWKQCFKSINSASPKVNGLLSRTLADSIKKCMICSEEIAKAVREASPMNYMLNYVCFAPVLKLLWEKVIKDNDSEAYESFKRYVMEFEDEDILELLFKICGLRMEHYSYIKNNNINQCLFFIEECNNLSNKENEFSQIVKTIMTSQGSGLCKMGSEWLYYSNGMLDSTFRGMVRNGEKWNYVSNGKIDYDYVGLCRKGDTWYYITNGTVNNKYTGLVMSDEGIWMYITNGEVDRNFVGLVETSNGTKYISNGTVDKEYIGLYKDNTGKQVYIQNGTINKNFMGLAGNDEGWWYVENGEINYSYNGFAKNNLGWCEVVNGKAKTETIIDVFKILKEEPVKVEPVKEEPIKEEPIKEEPPVNPVEVSIGYYANGQLGLKTIIKSIGAWGKYKFKR